MDNIPQKKERILAVDALRGFAVMCIMLLHNIEHFNFYSFPETSNATLNALDSTLWDMLFFTFAGKAYAIFALLRILPAAVIKNFLADNSNVYFLPGLFVLHRKCFFLMNL